MIARLSNAEYLRELRAKAIAEGRCSVCRCREPRPGNRICDYCIRLARERQRTGRGLERRRRSDRAKSKRRIASRKERGLCITCGRNAPALNRVSCTGCLEAIAARVASYYRSAK